MLTPRPGPVYQAKLVACPADLGTAELERIQEALVDLNYRAVRGRDRATYENSRIGWHEYYSRHPIRDLTRFITVYDGKRLAHFAGWKVLRDDPDLNFIWGVVSVSDPSYQGKGLMASAFPLIADAAWFRSFPPTTYVVARTINPWIYEYMARIAALDPAWAASFHPRIAPGATIEEVPPDTRRVAARIAARLSPNCHFDADRFVIRGFLSEFGSIYREPPPDSRVSATSEYFRRHVRYEDQDALLMLYRVV